MNINELSLNHYIVPEVYELVNSVIKLSNKNIEFCILKDLKVDGTTKIARERMTKHTIRLKLSQIGRANYLIAHECCHIIRLMEANQSDRIVPSFNNATTGVARLRLSTQVDMFPSQIRQSAIEVWIEGIIMQLTNLPIDARIEKWLYKNYPRLRKIQIASLNADAAQSLIGLSQEVERYTAKEIYIHSNAMVYAYLRAIGDITGENYSKKFRAHQDIVETGRKLFNILDTDDGGFNHDIDTIKAWGKILGVDNWISWLGFEDMPDSYFETDY